MTPHYYMISVCFPGGNGCFEYSTAAMGRALARELNDAAKGSFPNAENIMISSVYDCGEDEEYVEEAP